MLVMTREQLESNITEIVPDDWERDDALELVELLCRRFSPLEAWTWAGWFSDAIDGVPLVMLANGRAREVFQFVRQSSAQ